MIVVASAPALPAEVTFAIDRIITIDSTGDERFWNPEELWAAHPELIPRRRKHR